MLTLVGTCACSSQKVITIVSTVDGATTSTSTSTSVRDSAVPPIPDGPSTSTSTSDGPSTSTAVTDGQSTATATADALATDTAPPLKPVNLPFHDDFSSGFEPNWAAPAGDAPAISDIAHSTVSLDTTDPNTGDFSRLSVLVNDAVNISASMTFRIDSPPSSGRMVRLTARQSPTTVNIFYAVGASIDSGTGAITKVGIFKKVPYTDSNGKVAYTICALTDPNKPDAEKLASPVAISQWRTIALKISGTSPVTLTAYYEKTVMVTVTDDCTSPLVPTGSSPPTVPNGGCLADQTAVGIQVDKGMKASVDQVDVVGL